MLLNDNPILPMSTRTPRTGVSFLLRIKDWFARLVARDMHVAATFCRRFYWSDVNLW